MKFSLILATTGRTDELSNFLYHLLKQEFDNYELIIVDQNDDDRLVSILTGYQEKLPIIHLKSGRGLSKARNTGISKAQGEVIGFPDDDCWYPPDLLEKVSVFLINKPNISGVTGRVIDEKGNKLARYAIQGGYLTKYNTWERTSSVSMFMKTPVIRDIGGFDENLGLGAETIYQGGEDIELPIRAVEKGYQIYYEPEIIVYHPGTSTKNKFDWYQRAFGYGAGIGYVWRKHNFPILRVMYYLIRPLVGSMLSLASANLVTARYYWYSFRGRWVGWHLRD